MRILVISDTHIPVAEKKLPHLIEKEAKQSDYCLHAGDFLNYSVFNELSSWTKTFGVYGNMDEPQVRDKLPKKEVIEFGEVTLGLIHGGGTPSRLIYYINDAFSKNFEKIDIFVFGHSHFPLNKEIEGKIYFNPGSLTDKVFAPYRSYGILNIEGKTIKRRIIKIE